MKFSIRELFESIVGAYVKLPLAQKIALPLFLFGTMGIIIFISRWAGRPDYAVLFSGLDDADAGAIVEKLKDQKIGFQLRDDGRTIDITPARMVSELRLELASSGLPRSGTVGLELLNDSPLGRTAFQERVLYLRGLQGELERTIQSIEAIKRVRVHITEPERSVFTSKDVLPTASVLLKLKIGAELSKEQIKGISNLVARSVERLQPENVTIVDSRGNLLNEHRSDEETQGADLTRLEYQRSVEASFIKRIESMLTQVLGPEHAVARVTAELDFNRLEREEEAFDPGSQVARSERSVEENAGQKTEGGVPGVVSNLTNDPGLLTPPDGAKSSNVKRESVKNYEVSRAVSKTTTAVGKIIRLSVAVLVDGQYLPAPTPDASATQAPKKIYQPLSPEMMKQLESLVKQAVGFDSSRGDSVSVENIRFFEPDESLEAQFAATSTSDMLWKWSWVAGPTALILLFFLVIVRPMVRFLVNPTEAEVDLTRLLPAGVEELEAELQAERSRMSALPDSSAPGVDIEELEELLAENSKFVKQNPQQAALLIRYWINEGRM